MITEEDIKIDYRKVFSILPDIMGMPLTRVKTVWHGARKMDGSYSSRADKLVCRMVTDGIQILEQGGEAMTLFNWMIKYGGCRTRMDARLKLLSMSSATLAVPEYLEKEPELRYVPKDFLRRSMESRVVKKDNFTLFLHNTFGSIQAEYTLKKYMVGTFYGRTFVTGCYENLTQFWYINKNDEICHDKKILYKADGHRDHNYGGGRGFTKGKGYSGKCLFGEHLLSSRKEGERIFVVESEKTAILADLYFKQGIWLATGGKCNYVKRVEEQRGWTFVSDVDAWEYWKGQVIGKCPRWWESYPGYVPGEHDDIGDLILNFLIKR